MDNEELAVEYFLGCAADPPSPSREIRFRNTADFLGYLEGARGSSLFGNVHKDFIDSRSSMCNMSSDARTMLWGCNYIPVEVLAHMT